MNTIYTLEDIQQFLSQKYSKFQWNYQIYDSKTGKKRQATLDDFTANTFHTLPLVIIYRDSEYSLDINISDFNFIIYEDEPNIMGSGSTQKVKDNFSDEWINFLLDKYEEFYAKNLLIYSETNKKRINDEMERKIEAYRFAIKEKAEKDLSPYESLSRKAKDFLSIGDIIEVQQLI